MATSGPLVISWLKGHGKESDRYGLFLDWVLIRCLLLVQSALTVLAQWEEWAVRPKYGYLKAPHNTDVF